MKFIKSFREIGLQDVSLVGGKTASLGQMISGLSEFNIKVPQGFAITASAYWYLLEHNQLLPKLKDLLGGMQSDNIRRLHMVGKQIRELIYQASIPDDLIQEVDHAYTLLSQEYHQQNLLVAVRSSATAEDLPNASFAGQQETYLAVTGPAELLDSVKKCWASLFTDRAIFYRTEKGFDHFQVALSIAVQKMVHVEHAASGVAFSLETDSGFADVIMINGSYGLGESIVKGLVTPDEFIVSKRALRTGYEPILKKQLGSKQRALVYNTAAKKIEQITVSPAKMSVFCLTNSQVITLSRYVLQIEEYYSAIHKRWTPMDIEWAQDSTDKQIYIIQARPETVHAHKDYNILVQYRLSEHAQRQVIATGQAIGQKIVTGIVRVIESVHDIHLVQKGDIIVTTMTDPDWVPVMKIAAGIITEKGGRTCHAVIVSRELDIPAIIGVDRATQILSTGQEITLDCSESSIGFIYHGAEQFDVQKTSLQTLPAAPVPLYVNIADVESAYKISHLPVSGVGLVRIEFIITNVIKVHPMALLCPERITDEGIQRTIQEMTEQWDSPSEFFIEQLSQAIATVAAAFYPRTVIVRCSDFKTNEYRNLIGGIYFEPEEENPMLGLRGAFRYYHPDYYKAFALECHAITRVRDKMGWKNVSIMIPFVRTLQEAALVTAQLHDNGLERGKDGLEIIMMCEVPSNVLLIEKFSAFFDGFSIGSNDLTQMVLGVDRDSASVATLFDERDKAVRLMCEMAIFGAHQQKKPIGICGQAPSDYPDFADYLIDTGIDYMSLNSNMIIPFLLRYVP